MSKWKYTIANQSYKDRFLESNSFFFKSKSIRKKDRHIRLCFIRCELIVKTIFLNGYARLRKLQLTLKFHRYIAPHASLLDNLSHCCIYSIPCNRKNRSKIYVKSTYTEKEFSTKRCIYTVDAVNPLSVSVHTSSMNTHLEEYPQSCY